MSGLSEKFEIKTTKSFIIIVRTTETVEKKDIEAIEKEYNCDFETVRINFKELEFIFTKRISK